MLQTVIKTRTMLMFSLAIAIAILALVNLSMRIDLKPLPDDGVAWVETGSGVTANSVRTGSAADRAGIVRGDLLRYVSFGDDKYFTIERSRDIYFILEEEVKIGGSITYTIERRLSSGKTALWDADVTNIEPEPSRLPLQVYLGIVGLIFLIVGLYVLVKQPDTPYTTYFSLLCIAVFAVLSLSYVGHFTSVDNVVFLTDTAAFIFLAPLFFHFSLIFPFRRKFLERHRWTPAIFYLPAAALLILRVGIFVVSRNDLDLLRWHLRLNKAETAQFSIAFLTSAVLLLLTFVQTRATVLRQQLKWVVWGLSLSALPFAIFYAYPYILGNEISQLQAALATGPLILLPISFGYSIVRYRLMDVDIIVRRSMTYALAMMSVVVIFMLGVVKAGEWVRELAPPATQGTTLLRVDVLFQVAVMSIAAMLFGPIKNWLEERVDRLFFGERYDYRRGLADFGRTLSSTTELADLLDALARRLSEMLSLKRLAIFIEDDATAEGFRLAYASDMPFEPLLTADFSAIAQNHHTGRGYILADEIEVGDGDSNRRALHYYIPCYARDRLVAVIGLGRTIEGAMLTSEDIKLVCGLSGYVAVAIENSLLYRSEKEKAAALARLKEFSENIIESINIGLVAIDREGRITNWNSALEELLAISREAAVGHSMREVFDDDLLNTIHNATGTIGWEVSDVHNIYRYKAVSRDGRELVINISLSPLEATDTRLAGTLILIEDITARVRLEEQMRETDKLSSIGLLAAGVAHEVNTPLTGISSYTQMLLGQIPMADPKYTVLEKIKRQALRASDIVNNLLNFSRTGNVEFAELDVNRILDDTIQLLEPQLRNTQIMIERQYGEGLPNTIGNSTKLQQVFMNLLLNARDAMPGGGKLTICTLASEGMLFIDVLDTGIGIASENITKIYDPFFTTKGVGQGTGLGLAVSYGIIQEHKGRIFVESKPGQGTRFRIKLPSVNHRLHAIAGD
jgi:two-component system, NtrC family, sensor kinase